MIVLLLPHGFTDTDKKNHRTQCNTVSSPSGFEAIPVWTVLYSAANDPQTGNDLEIGLQMIPAESHWNDPRCGPQMIPPEN